MTGWAVPLRPGLPVSFDGDPFTVAEIEGSRVMLRRTGTTGAPSWRQVELVALLSHPSTRILPAAPEPQAAVAAVRAGRAGDGPVPGEGGRARDRGEHGAPLGDAGPRMARPGWHPRARPAGCWTGPTRAGWTPPGR